MQALHESNSLATHGVVIITPCPPLPSIARRWQGELRTGYLLGPFIAPVIARGRQRTRMPRDPLHGRKVDASVEQGRDRRPAHVVRAYGRKTGLRCPAVQDVPDRLITQRALEHPLGLADRPKHRPALHGARLPPVVQGARRVLAHVYRACLAPLALANGHPLFLLDIIIPRQRDELAPSEAGVIQQRDDRLVAYAGDAGIGAARGEERCDLGALKRAATLRRLAAHGVDVDRPPVVALVNQVEAPAGLEDAAEGGDALAGSGGGVALGEAACERRRVRDAQRVPRDGVDILLLSGEEEGAHLERLAHGAPAVLAAEAAEVERDRVARAVGRARERCRLTLADDELLVCHGHLRDGAQSRHHF